MMKANEEKKSVHIVQPKKGKHEDKAGKRKIIYVLIISTNAMSPGLFVFVLERI